MTPKIALFADDRPKPQEIASTLRHSITFVPPDEADIYIVLGGDGYLLRVLHGLLKEGKSTPVYGINCGSVGFLMNALPKEMISTQVQKTLHAKLNEAQRISLTPLSMNVKSQDGQSHKAYALNEVSLLRQTSQIAKIRVLVDNIIRIEELVSDGALLSTPAGSTAYNFSAFGPILPLDANLLALTPINAFRPRRWRGALLPRTAKVQFEVLMPEKRPVSATADFYEIRNILSVSVEEDSTRALTLLFDPEHNLERRILEEQFMA